jgi:hypothetical protein
MDCRWVNDLDRKGSNKLLTKNDTGHNIDAGVRESEDSSIGSHGSSDFSAGCPH